MRYPALYTCLLFVFLLPLTGTGQSFMNCTPNTGTCNLIPNPGFTYQSLNTYIHGDNSYNGAFFLGEVDNWYSVSETPDLNNIASAPSALPAGTNWATMGISFSGRSTLTTSREDIVTPTRNIQYGHTYAMSFFRAASSTGTPSTFQYRVVLTTCAGFEVRHLDGTPQAGPAAQQVVYCEVLNPSNGPWDQVFITFTANADYNAVWIYPMETATSTAGTALFHFAMPELIDLEDFRIIRSQGATSCRVNLSPSCTLTNAAYSWTGPNGYTNSGTLAMVNSATTSGIFNLSMTVPNAITNAVTCATNGSAPLTASIPVIPCCTTAVVNGTVKFTAFDDVTDHWNYRTEPLNFCNTNRLCFMNGRQVELRLFSSFPTGNYWEITENGGNFIFSIDDPYAWNPIATLGGIPQDHIQIKLTNNGNVYYYYIYVSHSAEAGQCISSDPNYDFHFAVAPNDPANSYAWTLPAGMTPNSFTGSSIRVDASGYGSGYPTTGTLTVTNSDCNMQYTAVFGIRATQDVFCTSRPAAGDQLPEVKAQQRLVLSPNPTTGVVRFTGTEKILSVSIYSIEGKLVKKIDKPLQAINISELRAGAYLCSIMDASGEKTTTIIIKQ